jgi:hypothetical protein
MASSATRLGMEFVRGTPTYGCLQVMTVPG